MLTVSEIIRSLGKQCAPSKGEMIFHLEGKSNYEGHSLQKGEKLLTD